MAIDKRWTAVSVVPTAYLKPIGFGGLKGKSDINPQWRIKAMTETYGLCGIGWYYDVEKVEYRKGAADTELIFIQVAIFVKDGENWSMPIRGAGGDVVIEKNNSGLRDNDEAYKMALTDALGNAMKYLGVASEIYEGHFDGSKYAKQPIAATGSTPPPPPPSNIDKKAAQLGTIMKQFDNAKELAETCYKKYNVKKLAELTESQLDAEIKEHSKALDLLNNTDGGTK